MTHTQTTSTGIESNFIVALAEILGIAAREPSTLDEANEILYAIEDLAAEAIHRR